MPEIIDKYGNIVFFGRLTLANLLNWLITVILGAILLLTTIHLGGVRPEASLALLPLYVLLLCLHGVWLLDAKEVKKVSLVPCWFVPLGCWMFVSARWVSPLPWLGWQEWILTLQAFVFLWILVNNVRGLSQLATLLSMGLIPLVISLFNGYYQFFQDPARLMGGLTEYQLYLSSEYLGRSTGVFADPFSFAAFLIILLPAVLIASLACRLPVILRIFCGYVVLLMFGAIAFTQVYWSVVCVAVLLGWVPWFCFRWFRRRMLASICGVGVVGLLFALSVVYHPKFAKGLDNAMAEGGEGVRQVLWKEALRQAAESPFLGLGLGTFGVAAEQSPLVSLGRLAESPHNDYLLLLSQLGFVGLALFVIPICVILVSAYRALFKEPFVIKTRDRKDARMPLRRFSLSLALGGCLAVGLCMAVTFVFHVPALTLYSVLFLGVVVTLGLPHRVVLPNNRLFKTSFGLLFAGFGIWFYVFSAPKLESVSLQQRSTQELEDLVGTREVFLNEDKIFLDLITSFEASLSADSGNVNALIGLSATLCQLYYLEPSQFYPHGLRAVQKAEQAVALAPDYWSAWAQLGVAQSFSGNILEAEAALLQALELAPNLSETHYYYAALIGADGVRRQEALQHVRRALEINSGNEVARRLEQKLSIL